MIGLVLRRLGQGVPTLLAVVALSFFLMRLAPGGPFDLERPLSPAAMENLRRSMGWIGRSSRSSAATSRRWRGAISGRPSRSAT